MPWRGRLPEPDLDVLLNPAIADDSTERLTWVAIAMHRHGREIGQPDRSNAALDLLRGVESNQSEHLFYLDRMFRCSSCERQ